MINKFFISIILFIMPSLAFSAKNVKYIECDYTETVVANVSHKPHKLLKLIDRERGIFERKGKIVSLWKMIKYSP